MTMTLNTAQAPAAKPPRPVTELVRARPRKDVWPATGQSREEVWVNRPGFGRDLRLW